MKKVISTLLKRFWGFIGFFRFEISIIILMGICFGLWAGQLIGTAFGTINPKITFIISNLGWFVSLISFGWMLHIHFKNGLQLLKTKVEIMEEYMCQLNHVKEALDRAYGYDEKLDKTVSIYSKLVKTVGAGTANALVNFALTTNPDDTIFLIRVNHGLETWHFQVAGQPIHFEQARAIILASVSKIEVMAGPDSLIQKKDLVQN